MPSNPSSRLVKLAALCLLAACSDQEENPKPITRLVFPPDARALVVLGDELGQTALHAVDAAGVVTPVGHDGEGIRLPFPVFLDGDRIEHVWNPFVGRVVPVSADAFAATFTGADDPRNRPGLGYAKATALVARDGTLTMLPLWTDGGDPCELQADGSGRVYFAELDPVTFSPYAEAELRPVLMEGGVARLDWPISVAGDYLTSYAVDDAGNVGYRAVRDGAGSSGGLVGVLRPAVGAAVTWPVAPWRDVEDLGSFWRAADGRLHVTRMAAADPATTELLRIDFDPAPLATPIAAWTGAPGILHGWPHALGDARAFVRGGEVVVVRPGAAAPEVHALGFTPREVRPSGGALWFVTSPPAGAPSRLVRWTAAGGAVDAVGDAYDVDRAEPYDDDHALAAVTRRTDGARLLVRAAVGAAPEPLDVGLPSPRLVDGLVLP